MDLQTGEIHSLADVKRTAALRRRMKAGLLKEMGYVTSEQMKRLPPRVRRNDRCPCGSGMKFKKCCMVQEGAV